MPRIGGFSAFASWGCAAFFLFRQLGRCVSESLEQKVGHPGENGNYTTVDPKQVGPPRIENPYNSKLNWGTRTSTILFVSLAFVGTSVGPTQNTARAIRGQKAVFTGGWSGPCSFLRHRALGVYPRHDLAGTAIGLPPH